MLRNTFCNVRTGVVAMGDRFSITVCIPKSNNLRKDALWIVSACPFDSFRQGLYHVESVGIPYKCNHYFLTCNRPFRERWWQFIMWKPDPIKMIWKSDQDSSIVTIYFQAWCVANRRTWRRSWVVSTRACFGLDESEWRNHRLFLIRCPKELTNWHWTVLIGMNVLLAIWRSEKQGHSSRAPRIDSLHLFWVGAISRFVHIY
jgi:hypothetical protein